MYVARMQTNDLNSFLNHIRIPTWPKEAQQGARYIYSATIWMNAARPSGYGHQDKAWRLLE
jgi:hypothetical protein